MFRILLAASLVAFVSPLLAEETDQAVLNQEALDEIREIRGSLTLGEAMEGDAEAFSKALITVVSDAAADETNKQEEANKEPEVCPNGGSCCENVSSKVIAKAMMARIGQQANVKVNNQPNTQSFVNPHNTIQQRGNTQYDNLNRSNLDPNPPSQYLSPSFGLQVVDAPTQHLNTNVHPPQPFPSSHHGWRDNFSPHPYQRGPHHDGKNHHTIHTLRETAHELDRIAHRLEMANLCDAADEIRDAACELREEARDLLDEDHDEDEECDEDECEDDHDHEGHHHDESHDHDHDD